MAPGPNAAGEVVMIHAGDMVFHTQPGRGPAVVDAEGCWLVEESGRRLLDMEAGIWCVVLGHGHRAVQERAAAQMARVVHTPKRLLSPVVEEAAQAVAASLPGGPWRVAFLSSGSEAVEFALRIAREFTGRTPLAALRGSYLSALGTGKALARGDGFPELALLPASAGKVTAGGPPAAEVLAETLDRQREACGPPAALVLESLLVSSGIHQPDTELALQACDRVRQWEGLVIANEVTTGLGRTGRWYGFQHHGVEPEIVVLGKALGNGFPVSAVAVRKDLADTLSGQGFYYAQSHMNDPFGCAVAAEVLRVLETESVVESADRIGAALGASLAARLERWPTVSGVRGVGLVWGIELRSGADAGAVWRDLLERGVYTGVREEQRLLRLLPPLTISGSETAICLEALDEVLVRSA